MPSRAFSRFNRSASTLMLAASLAVLPLLTGCDNPTHTADKDVEDQIVKAESSSDLAAAQNQLDAAVQNTTASTAMKLRAKALQANNLLKVAQQLAHKVSKREAIITRLAADISLLADQIGSNNSQVAALKLLDPAKVQDSIKEKSAAITGSDDKPDWYKSDAGMLDSLSVNDKAAAGLQQQISQLQDTIKTETDQRTKLLADADDFNEKSEREKGDKAVDLYTQGSNNRKQAADLTTKLDQDNVLLARAQADLLLRQGQQESLKGSIKLLGDRASAVDDHWKTVQAQIDDTNAASKKIADNGTQPPDDDASDVKFDYSDKNPNAQTIAAKVALLDALVKKNETERKTAITKYDSAITFYKDAYGLANTFKKDLSPLPNDTTKIEYDQRKTQLNALDPTTFKYLQSDAEMQKASFLVGKASEQKTRLDLQTSLKKPYEDAQLTIPLALVNDNLESDMKETLKAAIDTLGVSDSTAAAGGAIGDLTNLEQGAAPQEIKNAAGLDLIYAYYSGSQLETLAGDPQKAAEQMTLAKEKADSLQANNVHIPQLPAELASADGSSPTMAPGASGSPGQLYTILLDRPFTVGTTLPIDFKSSIAAGPMMNLSTELKGTMKVVAVSAAGGLTKCEITVDRCTQGPAELIKSGAVIVADATRGRPRFTVDGAAISTTQVAVTPLIALEKPGQPSTDMGFGTTQQQPIGGTWPLNPAVLAQMMSQPPLTLSPDQVKGSNKLLEAKTVDGVNQMTLQAEADASNISLKLPGGIAVKDGHVRMTVLAVLPVDHSLPEISEVSHLVADETVDAPTPDGKTKAVKTHVEMTEEKHYGTPSR